MKCELVGGYLAADAILYSGDAGVVSDNVAALRQPATIFVRNKCAAPLDGCGTAGKICQQQRC